MGVSRTFCIASNEALVDLITRARNRLVVVAPALRRVLGSVAPGRRGDAVGGGAG